MRQRRVGPSAPRAPPSHPPAGPGQRRLARKRADGVKPAAHDAHHRVERARLRVDMAVQIVRSAAQRLGADANVVAGAELVTQLLQQILSHELEEYVPGDLVLEGANGRQEAAEVDVGVLPFRIRREQHRERRTRHRDWWHRRRWRRRGIAGPIAQAT